MNVDKMNSSHLQTHTTLKWVYDESVLSFSNTRADNITIYTNGSWGCRVLLPLKRKNKWVDEDIDSFQFGSFINSLRQKEPLRCKSQGVVEEMLGWEGIK